MCMEKETVDSLMELVFVQTAPCISMEIITYRIIESFRLENTLQIIESNC